jgi:DNA-binding NarL/FixJ family response regulator
MLLVGDDALARESLRHSLEGEPLVEIVAQSDSEGAAEVESGTGTEVALWDLGMAPRSSLDVALLLAARQLDVLALAKDARWAALALEGGLSGALERSAPASKIASAALAVREGNRVIDDAWFTALFPRHRTSLPEGEPLTPREREVLELLASGQSNKEIASRLHISEHTAKFHVNSLFAKLGTQNRTEAVVRAAQLGLLFL